MKVKSKLLKVSGVFFVSLIFLIGVASIGLAQSGTPKIGFVDVTKIMRDSKAAKSSLAVLQKEIESKRATMKGKSEKLANMDKELKTLKQDSAAWKDKRDKLTKEANDFNRLRGEFDEQLQKKNVELTQKIFADVQQIIKKIAASEKYTIILEKRTALLADESTDLTDKVIKMYDAQKK